MFFLSTLLPFLLPTAATQTTPPPAPYLRTPSPRQLAWHSLEYYAFLHFGPNTFTSSEWGTDQPLPSVFNPTSLSTDQWASTFASAGMTAMILTAKHHDGMALWPTNTTTYKIDSSPWAHAQHALNLSSNVVLRAAASARKYNLKFGIYLSPWDIHRDPAMPKPHLDGTAYAEPQIFGDASPGDYNAFYARQLTELVSLTHDDGAPIDLFEIWLDGASGSDTVQTFDWALFRDIIREYQPGAVMWGHQGVDARWVGNEDGTEVLTNWHAISRTQDDARYEGGELEVGVRDGAYWTPAEADARIREGWFWHEEEVPKGRERLMQMWMETVGRSVNLLLDCPPDTEGRIPEGDVRVLKGFKELREGFLNRTLLGEGLEVRASSVRGGDEDAYGPAKVLDGKAETYWAMDDDQTTGSLEVHLSGVYRVDAVVLQEHIALGQRIGGYAVDAGVNGTYRRIANGTSMGYKRVWNLTESVVADSLRVEITQANATPLLNSFQALGVKL